MLDDLLTAEEKDFFNRHGYLIVEDALSNKMINRLHVALGNLMQGKEVRPLNKADILGDEDAFLDLIDLSTLFPKIWGIMGPNIWVNHSHCNVIPTEQKQDKIYYGWHRDGGTIHFDLVSPAPLMALKTAFYLNDIDNSQVGETYVIPGSHFFDSNELNLGVFDIPPRSAIPLKLKAGTAVIYHPRLIHSLHSPNYSNITRQAVFIQWAYRWLAPVDPMHVEHLKDRVKDPIRRQLLGFTTNEGYIRDNNKLPYAAQLRSGRYYPRLEDIPLRQYMENLQQEVKGRIWSL